MPGNRCKGTADFRLPIMKTSQKRHCFWCGSLSVWRVERHGIDWLFSSILNLRPYWCDDCGRKFYRRPSHENNQRTLASAQQNQATQNRVSAN
jgi:hypothetical protein